MESRFHFFSKTPPEWSEGLPVLSPTYKRVKKNNEDSLKNYLHLKINEIILLWKQQQFLSFSSLVYC